MARLIAVVMARLLPLVMARLDRAIGHGTSIEREALSAVYRAHSRKALPLPMAPLGGVPGRGEDLAMGQSLVPLVRYGRQGRFDVPPAVPIECPRSSRNHPAGIVR